MRGPWPYPPWPPRGSEHGTSETDTLQTDVMRFMAILGFVLMAIFALVQAIPLTPASVRPALDDPAELAAELERLRSEVGAARRRLAELQSAAARAEAEAGRAERARDAALQALAQAEEETERARHRREALASAQSALERDLEQTRDLLAEARTDLEERRQELAALEHNIDARRRNSSDVRVDLRRQRRELAETRQKLDSAARLLDTGEESASRAARPADESPAESPDKSAAESPDAGAAEPDGSGFRLFFASEEALASLTAAREVHLYAMLGDRAWRLIGSGSERRFRATSKPARFYEMRPNTVPDTYVSALQKAVTVFDASAVTWGVTLPAGISAQIERLVAQRRGGELVIQADGSVEGP